jgi:hypothetical protein
MRGPGAELRRVGVARAAAAGLLGGILGTAGMYVAAVAELAATSVPSSQWAAAAEVGLGGRTGAILGLSGAPLHFLHGAGIGLAVGFLAGAIRGPATGREVLGLGIGIGLLLWGSLLALDPATRGTSGAGPPVVLAFVLHLVYGLVVAIVVARLGQRPAPAP